MLSINNLVPPDTDSFKKEGVVPIFMAILLIFSESLDFRPGWDNSVLGNDHD